MSDSASREVAGTSFISMWGNGFRVVVSFFATVVMSRGFGAEGFGQISLILGYTIFLHYLLTAGFEHALTFYVPGYLTEKKFDLIAGLYKTSIVCSLFLATILLTILSFVCGPLLSKQGMSGLLIPTLILGWQMELGALGYIFSGLLKGFKRFRPVIIKDQLLFPGLHLIGVSTIVLWGKAENIVYYTVAYLLTNLFCTSYAGYHSYRVVRQNLSVHPSGVFADKRQILSWIGFSAPLGLTYLLENLHNWVSVILAGWLLSVGDVGRFTTSLRVATFAQFFLIAAGPIFSPYLAELFKLKKRGEFSNLYKDICYWSSKWSILFLFVMVFVGDYVLAVFGKEFGAAYYMLVILTVGSLFEGCLGSVRLSLIMAGHNKINIINFLLSIMLNIFLTFPMVETFSVLGVALANSLAMVFLNLLRAAEFYYLYRVTPFNLRQLRNLLILLGVMAVVCLLGLSQGWSGRMRLGLSVLIFTVGVVGVYWNDRHIFVGRFLRRLHEATGRSG